MLEFSPVSVSSVYLFEDLNVAKKRTNVIIMESFENTPMQYAYLQPLKILNDDDDDQHQEVDFNDSNSNSTEGLALTPIKEEIVTRDLQSYFFGRGKLLFDEPESLPIIYWVEAAVQQTRTSDDGFGVMKMRKVTKPSLARKKFKKILERTVSCNTCDRKFVTLRHMKIHAASHLKKRKKSKKKFSCAVCRRFFIHGGALYLHMRSHKKLKLRKRK